jgi:hypothetical protein
VGPRAARRDDPTRGVDDGATGTGSRGGDELKRGGRG